MEPHKNSLSTLYSCSTHWPLPLPPPPPLPPVQVFFTNFMDRLPYLSCTHWYNSQLPCQYSLNPVQGLHGPHSLDLEQVRVRVPLLSDPQPQASVCFCPSEQISVSSSSQSDASTRRQYQLSPVESYEHSYFLSAEPPLTPWHCSYLFLRYPSHAPHGPHSPVEVLQVRVCCPRSSWFSVSQPHSRVSGPEQPQVAGAEQVLHSLHAPVALLQVRVRLPAPLQPQDSSALPWHVISPAQASSDGAASEEHAG